MTIETREEFLERLMSRQKPNCPYCKTEMSIWEVPMFTFSDGLGWGAPYLFVCFNDDCSLYKEGWRNIESNYSHKASYRCMCYPDTEQFECIPVFSSQGAKGQIVDDEALAAEESRKEAIKRGFAILADAYREKNWVEAVRLLLDGAEPPECVAR